MGSCVQEWWIKERPEVVAYLEWLDGKRLKRVGNRRSPYPLGSGPLGECCGRCAKLRVIGGYRQRYFKCGVMRAFWTHGRGTDIRKKDPACLSYEPRGYEKVDLGYWVSGGGRRAERSWMASEAL